MPEVRDLTPEDAPELTALYADYEWWDDREVEGVRDALAETEVAVGVRDEEDDRRALGVTDDRRALGVTVYGLGGLKGAARNILLSDRERAGAF